MKTKDPMKKINLRFAFCALAAAVTSVSLMSCSVMKRSSAILTVSDVHAGNMIQQAATAENNGNHANALELNKQGADEYARIGELLLALPEGTEYADKQFALSLQADPTNQKALFYKSTTEPALLARGFLTKAEPLATEPYEQESLERARQDIDKLKMPEVTKIAYAVADGDKLFYTNYDVQRFAREKVLPALLASVEKLNMIDATVPLKLNFTPKRFFVNSTTHEYDSDYTNCNYDTVNGYQCSYYHSHYVWNSDKNLRNEYFIDQHDLRVLKSAMMGAVNTVRLATAYSLKDSELAFRRLRGLDRLRRNENKDGLSAQDIVNVLRSPAYPQLMTLEADNQLSTIADSTAQILRTAIDLSDLKTGFCGNNARNIDNSLFIKVNCPTFEFIDSLHTSLDMIAGPKEIELGKDEAGKSVRIVIDITANLKNPVKDERTLLPTSFDENGNATDYPDPSMNGLFPNGDLIEKFKQLSDSSLQYETGLKKMRDALRGTLKPHASDDNQNNGGIPMPSTLRTPPQSPVWPIVTPMPQPTGLVQ